VAKRRRAPLVPECFGISQPPSWRSVARIPNVQKRYGFLDGSLVFLQ
jgi:hypothetical protein